jgi:hypothetical protein
MAMSCELHTDNPLGYSMNARGDYSTNAPLCACIKAGDFNSLNLDETEKEMLSDAYDTITALDLWDWMRDPNTPGDKGFLFSDAPEITKIINSMNYKDHSGSSFGLTLRTMQKIAVYGWDAYLKTIKPYKYRVTVRWPSFKGYAYEDKLYDTEAEAQAVANTRQEVIKATPYLAIFGVERV